MIALLLILQLATVANVAGITPCTHPTKRHASVARHFRMITGYPHGRPGYVIDHIIPLCACGPDTVANMQWQTASEAEIKDAQERLQCRALRTK